MDKSLVNALVKGSKGRAKPAAPKHLKEFHAKEQSDGKYHVSMHSGKPSEAPVEHSAEDMSAVQAALEQHMGTPNEGEAEAEAPAMGEGQPAMGGQ